MFENIPVELRAYPQWVVWRLEDTESGLPTKVPYSPLNSRHANVNDASTWAQYDQAIAALSSGWWSGIGFVLTDKDPFGFIDLDAPKKPDGSPVPPDEYEIVMNRQRSIYNEFDSYAELSPSGKGLHIIIKGSLPNGRKRSSIEVYSNSRFMTMTGNVYRASEIKEHNELFNSLWAEMGKGRDAGLFYAGLEKATLTEEEILEIAARAANGEKFHDLFYTGNWQKYYSSQSEADFALINIIGFYSKNRAQTQEIFLKSKIGQREKSRAQYRLNYMLNRCFDNLLPPIDFDGLRDQVNAAIEKRLREDAERQQIERTVNSKAINIEEDKAYLDLELPAELPERPESVYSVPPGLVGEIAMFVYAQAPLPVPEIALTAAIGLMSGIVGKAYNISNTGLNQYTLLLSPTGSGKEAIASGINKIMRKVKEVVPPALDFIGPAEIASPQALTKCLADTPSIVSLVGEFGLALKAMASENAAPAQLGLRRMYLDLFNKSGESDQMQKTIYSDKDKNTSVVNAPAFSLIGESTPERFYEILTENMISEGLLPRFNIIENLSPPADFNEGSALALPSPELIRNVATLCANALGLINQKKVIHVQETPEAREVLKKFRELAYNNVKASVADVRKQLWNRAHIKALKLAATVAIGVNPFEPRISVENARWAIKIVTAGVHQLLARFENGEVGIDNDESKQIKAVIEKIRQFIVSPWDRVSKTAADGVFESFHKERIVPYSYIQRSVISMAPFRRDKLGATNALKRALKTLVERGDLEEVGKAELIKKLNSKAVAYMVVMPHTFGI